MTTSKRLRNIHACLVHESRECVIDLVCNLHHLDPSSLILLYNGGTQPELLQRFPFDRYNAVVHPHPRPMKWGWLHDYALDCFRFALDHHPFDTMTIVDSDQLGLRADYSGFLSRFLAERPRVGLLGNVQTPQSGKPLAPPALNAMKELELWRPFLRRFPGGESKFPHWCFWPSTVFTADAARALVKLWDDEELQDILRRTHLWASEEILFPTLVAVLGYEVMESPCRYDVVKYRTRYSLAQLDAALAREDIFWAHPIPRRYDDPLRKHIRARSWDYGPPSPAEPSRPDLLLSFPILSEVRAIEGWLADEEADLLIASVARALTTLPPPHEVVEVGSYCGKATVVLGRVAEALGSEARIHAIDPLDGIIGARDQKLQKLGPTREKLEHNLRRAGLSSRVRIHPAQAPSVPWEAPISFLLIDGLHDYESVSQDCQHLEPWVVINGFVAFHDYADYYPGVKLFVHELLRSGRFRKVHGAGSLIVLQKLSAAARVEPPSRKQEPPASARSRPVAARPVESAPAGPLVSCIMPTANRRRFIPLALRCFFEQDFPARELIVVDDGTDPIADLLPADPRIRYIRLDRKHPIGTKRNLACQEARGEVIVHWDDDDWSAPHRLQYQVAALLRSRAAICGLTRVYYHQPSTGRSWQYVYPKGQRPWVSGNTLSYTKECWRKYSFPDIDIGEDARFIWGDSSRQVLMLEDCSFFVAMIHGSNVAPKRVEGSYWHPHNTEPILRLMGDAYEAYRMLGEAEAGRPSIQEPALSAPPV